MTTSDDSRLTAIDELRRSIIANAPAPAQDPADVARVAHAAWSTIRSGTIAPRATEVRVRLAGKGIPNHDVPVHTAAQLLDAVQGAVTAFGSAVKKQKRAKPPKDSDGHRMGVRKATELRLSANVAPGSVVFHLEGVREDHPKSGQLVDEGTDTLVDVALVELMRVLEQAQSDDGDAVGELTKRIAGLGAMVASKLSALADHASASEIELDLGHWSPSGGRSSALLQRRGADAIKDAVERNRVRVVTRKMEGTLRTVSDGADLCRLKVSEDKTIRLTVDPEVGQSLGALLGRDVIAEVEVTTTWKIASGRETETYRLLSADLAQSP